MLYAAKDDIGQAITMLSRANAIDERNFALILALGSERQKLAFLDNYFLIWTNLTLSLQSDFAPNDPRALNLAFTTLSCVGKHAVWMRWPIRSPLCAAMPQHKIESSSTNSKTPAHS